MKLMKTLWLMLAVLSAVTAAQAQTYSVVHHFGYLTNQTGFNARGKLVSAPDGTLYGTTIGGGIFDKGTVFEIQPDGTGFGLLKSFNGADGSSPEAGLLLV